ncbi:MAG: prolyl oligopeptidase family serine peptidase [Acidobacteriia bacterium]|nr:prolyl oligopeptidase family serine peptidase [Terriglobia bacterium]
MHFRKLLFAGVSVIALASFVAAQKKPLTLDDFFNSVGISELEMSSDGHAVIIGTVRPDWEQSNFRKDLWLWRDSMPGAPIQLTHSGHDEKARWSPNGHWIAFLSERKLSGGKDADSDSDDPKDKTSSQIFLISTSGGEAFPATSGDEDVHALSWSQDSQTLYFSTRIPWTKAQQDTYKKDWKDVVQFRAAERGDELFSLTLKEALANYAAQGTKTPSDPDPAARTSTPGSQSLGSLAYRISEIETSPDGKKLGLATTSVSERMEVFAGYEIYVVDLAGPSHAPRQITHNEGVENEIRWAADSRRIFFNIGEGAAEGKYQDFQDRAYTVDSETGHLQRWAADFEGSVPWNAVAGAGLLATGNVGTEVQVYQQASPEAAFKKLAGWPGTYGLLSTAKASPRIAFVYSSLQKPTEVYVAESADKLAQAQPISSFNRLFTERELPQGKPFRWKADDGVMVEGMLIYPPGKFEARNLPMLTLIHGGPADADGDHFAADWYQWSALAATSGWLVFEPNYRGSTGYGDKFLQRIVPEIVSRPGKDILEGVDALVKDGIADPEHLAIAGYSYGGYMTNWLITQTTRFKAAMTGAGAVEHVANWGNDDTTFDDAYYLGGRPWEAPKRYQDEAAIFQINKVKTPTHMVAGASDIRVAVLEDYLLDRALNSLGIPSTLLIFPGEGHSLSKNPWHGKIKVREELKWLEKYGGKPVR